MNGEKSPEERSDQVVLLRVPRGRAAQFRVMGASPSELKFSKTSTTPPAKNLSRLALSVFHAAKSSDLDQISDSCSQCEMLSLHYCKDALPAVPYLLKKIPALGTARIFGDDELVGTTLEAAESCTDLRQVQVNNPSPSVVNALLQAGWWDRLRWLSMPISQIPEVASQLLRSFPRSLARFNCSNGPSSLAELLAVILARPNFRELRVSDVQLNQTKSSKMVIGPNLRVLAVRHWSDFDDEDVEIRPLAQIYKFIFEWCPRFTGNALVKHDSPGKVKVLKLYQLPSFDPSNREKLTRFSSVKALDVDDTVLGGIESRILDQFTLAETVTYRKLNIDRPRLIPACCTRLRLMGCQIAEGAFQAAFPNLTRLDLTGSKTTPQLLSPLHRNPILMSLVLSSTGLRPGSLPYFLHKLSVTSINLSNLRLLDADVLELSKHVSLRRLDLGLTRGLTSSDFVTLFDRLKLRWANVAGCAEFDFDCLVRCVRSETLRYLMFALTPAAKDPRVFDLVKQYPRIRFVFR